MKESLGTLVGCLAVAILAGSCVGEPTGPGARVGTLAVAPRFASLLADALVDVTAVRLVLSRPNATGASAATLDTVVTFPTGVDSVAVTLTVPLDREGLEFLLRIAMTDALGDTVFRAGPIPVRVSTTSLHVRIAQPVLTYVGIGANATGVRFVNPPLTVGFGQTVPLVAEAFDGQGVIPGTPIGFALANPADSVLAAIADPAIGSIVARSARGSVQVRAALLTGPSATHTILIQPTAANVFAQSGGGQTGAVGLPLAQPFVARVRAADGLGVRGVPVNFEVLGGGGTLSRLVDTTDVNGDARALLTVGTVPGAQSARAVVPSLGGATASFAATSVAGAASTLAFGIAPSNVTSGAIIAPAVTVRARDPFGNDVTSFVGSVTLALLNNPLGAVLGGTPTRTAVAGVATFNDLSITGLGTGITMRATSGALTAATSTGFNVTVGSAVSLQFSVEPAAPSAGTPFGVAVAARDAGGNVVPGFTDPITVAIGVNPSGGTLSGVTTVNAVAGIATFPGLSIDNVGAGYTLVGTRVGLTTATSAPFNVSTPAGVNAWVNATGGNWSTPGNWSLGIVPTASDIVWIRQTGTYTVNVDIGASVGRMLVGGTSGTQTLSIGTATLTMTDSVLVSTNGAVVLSGGAIAGTGAMGIASAFTWSGGDLSGTGARIRVLAGGTLAISGAATRSLNNFALEVAGTGTWTGSQNINSGSAGTIRVLSGGTLNIQGDPTWLFNQGGAPSAFEVLGALTRSTSAGTAVLPGFTVGGTATVASGVLELQGAGTSSGVLTAATGGTLRFSGGAQALTAASSVLGAGTVEVSGTGSVTSAGGWGVTGTTRLSGGTFVYNGVGTTTVLDLAGGTRAGSGALDVTGSMSWTSGDLSGGGGLTRTSSVASLAISGTATRTLNAQTLEIAGAATWSGTQTINSGSGGVLRVAATGTLGIQGDPSFLFNQGGAITILENLGSLTRTVSTGAVLLTARLNNSGPVTLSTGVLDLRGNGTLGGSFAVAAPAVLRFSTGTYTMQPGLAVTGAGSASLEGATLSGLAAPDTATFNTLALQTGQLNPGPGGVVRVNSLLDWSGAASLGGGGTTRVVPTGTVTMTGIATRQINTHTLVNEGTATWSGTFVLNSGSAARIRNSVGATFVWSGDGSYLFNQGGAQTVFENLGTFRRTGTGVAQLGAQLIDTLGTTFDLQAGELRLSSGGRIGGTKTLSGGTIELGAGTLSMRLGMLWSGVGGFVRVTGGVLTLDSAATVTVPRLDLAGGVLTHEGLLDVITTMNWSGGDITSNIVGLGGTTRVRAGGLMTISGTAARTFAGTHLLQMLGNTTLTGSGTINSGSGTVIANSGVFDLQGSGSVLFNQGGASPTFRNLGGATLRSSGATTGTIGFPVENLGALSVTGDSLRLSGGSSTAFAGTATVTTNALHLSGGTFTLTGALTTAGAAGNLVVGGVLALNSNTATVGGSFATVGTGSIAGTTATSSLTVAGNAAFGGGSSAPTAGVLQFGGNFTQSGATNSFLPTGTQRTVLSGTGTQNITFTNPTTSRFHRVEIAPNTRSVILQTNVVMTDSLFMPGGAGASTLIGAGATQRLTVNGVVRLTQSTSSPRLAPPVVEMSAVPAIDPIGIAGRGLTPDTAVYTGGNIPTLPVGVGIRYNSVRVSTTALMTLPADTIAGDLHLAGNIGFFAASTTFRIGGKLRTTGTGSLASVSTDVNLTVVDSTIFAGSTTNGLLTAGTLTALGAFVQPGGDPAAFSATGTFRVHLIGTGLQQVRFTNPGTTTTTSHFSDLQIGNSTAAGIQFLSPVFATSRLLSQPGRPAISRIFGTAADSLSINGILADSITFDGVPVRIGGTAALTNLSDFTFQNMNPAVTQFTITRAGGTFFPNAVTFLTVPNAGVSNLVVTNTAAAGPFTATFFNSAPTSTLMIGPPPRYLRLGVGGPLAVVVWNGVTLP